MASDNEPAKLLLPYLQRADELQKHEPLVAYYCRLYAMERGLKIPQNERTKMTNSILVSLMNQLEKDKKSLKLGPDDHLHLEGFALNVFGKADKQDRAGRSDINTAKTFYAASIFFEILNQFGELAPDLEQKQKYAAWKAADIRKAFKEGRKPVPGPPGGEGDLSRSSSLASDSYDSEQSQSRHDINPGPEPGPSAHPPPFRDELQRQTSAKIAPSPPSYPSADSRHTADYPPYDYQSPHSISTSGSSTYQPPHPVSRSDSSTFQPPHPISRSDSSGYQPPPLMSRSDSSGYQPPPLIGRSDSSTHSQLYHQPSFQQEHQPPYPQEHQPSFPQEHQPPYPQEHQPQQHVPQNYPSQEIPPSLAAYPNFQSYPSFSESSLPTAPTHYPSFSYQGANASYSHQSAPSVTNHPPPPPSQYNSTDGNGNVSDSAPISTQTYQHDINYQPAPEKIAEAHKAARFAVGALAFDDVPVAVEHLKKSLELLTNPSAGN